MSYLIYAVDDEQAIRSLYSCAFGSSDFCVRTFENGEVFFNELKIAIPDIILLDVMLDGIDGFEILKKLKENSQYSQIPVIMVSAKGEELDKVNGLNLGADDYLAKPFGILELIARVKANLRKNAKNTQLIYKDIQIDDSIHTIFICNEKKEFTLKEYNLLKLLVENKGKVVNRDEIFKSVWGENSFTETRTLDIHIAELRKKLDKSQVKINTIRGVGYLILWKRK